jgi:hypothetical protein
MKATKGQFKLAGFVNGVTREKFYKEITFDSGSTKREISFGVRTSKDTEVWVKIEQFVPKDLKNHKAKFQKWDKDTKKNLIEEVPWIKRHDFKKDGYRPQFDIQLEIDGEEKKNFFPLDAIEHIQDHLKDNMIVYVEGVMEYQPSVNSKGELTVFKNLKPTKIMISKKALNFDSESFEEINLFQQDIVFMGIEKSEEDFNGQPRYTIEAKIINNKKDENKKAYDEVADIELFTINADLAKTLRDKKKIKSFNGIQILGRFVNSVGEETVVEEDSWGERVEFKTANRSGRREMQIISARPSTLDTESYTEELIEQAVKAKKDFGKTTEQTVNKDDDTWV